MSPEPPTRDHERRYRELVQRVRAHVLEAVPRGARALAISRGDDSLLRVPGRTVEHFPQSPTGLYSGYHPADGAEASGHLEALRADGAGYFVVPATARWWLDHYHELRSYLEAAGEVIVDDPDVCVIYTLERQIAAEPTREELEAARVAPQVSGLLDALLPPDAGVALVGCAAEAVAVSARPCWRLVPPEQRRTESADEFVAHARAAGAQYLVLVSTDSAPERLDAALRSRLVDGLRPVFRRRLAEGYEFG